MQLQREPLVIVLRTVGQSFVTWDDLASVCVCVLGGGRGALWVVDALK